jgi:predicted DNA-binding protein
LDPGLIVFWQKHINLSSMRTTTVQLPDSVAQRAAAKARRMGISKSKVLREAIEKGLSGESAKASLAEMMSEVQGSIEGPANASVASKELYRKSVMEKYGKNTR